jgi:hypothetical protein
MTSSSDGLAAGDTAPPCAACRHQSRFLPPSGEQPLGGWACGLRWYDAGVTREILAPSEHVRRFWCHGRRFEFSKVSLMISTSWRCE